MKKQYVLFDLDGTLTDSQDGIINSIIHGLSYYGIQVEDRSSLRPFLGPPLIDSVMKYYGFDLEAAKDFVVRYREYYSSKGLFENQVYAGVREMLEELKSEGYKLMVATSKPEMFAKMILEHFDLLQYFDFVGGATMDEKRTNKGDVIRYVLEENGLTDQIQNMAMVGDRENDVYGARANGIPCIGVLYGYGGLEELQKAGADYLAEKPEDIRKFL